MKYSQFLKLDKVLKEKNIVIDDIKENHEVLNEVSIPLIASGILSGLGILFRKNLLRLGLKKYYLIRIENISEKFKKNLIKLASNMANQMYKTRAAINKKESEFKDNKTSENDPEYKSFLIQKLHYERKMYDYGLKKISKYVDKKTEQIEKMIDESSKLKDSQKIALKLYWDGLVPDLELSAFKVLIDNGIITNTKIIEDINTNLKKEKDELQSKFKTFRNKITSPEEEKTKETNKEEIKQTALKSDDL